MKTCHCDRYAFPHRPGGGACKGAGYCGECGSDDVVTREIGHMDTAHGADCLDVVATWWRRVASAADRR